MFPLAALWRNNLISRPLHTCIMQTIHLLVASSALLHILKEEKLIVTKTMKRTASSQTFI